MPLMRITTVQVLKNIEYRLQVLETSPHLFFPAFDQLNVSEELKDILIMMLKPNPPNRISIEELSKNPLFHQRNLKNLPLYKYPTSTDANCFLSKEEENATSPKPVKQPFFMNHQEKTIKSAESPQNKPIKLHPEKGSILIPTTENKTMQLHPEMGNFLRPTIENHTIQLHPEIAGISKPKEHKTSIEVFQNNYEYVQTKLLETGVCCINSYHDIEATIIALHLKYIPYPMIEKKGLIKSGGYGHVYNASYNKQDYALKEIPNVSFEFINKVLREAAFLRKNENPRLVKIYGVSYRPAEYTENSADLFLITELSAGDLQDFIEKKQLTFAQKLKIAFQIAQGVYHLHTGSTPLVHADLKPSNILLDESLKVFITDLGISKEISNFDITCSAAFTPGYAAPEQIINEVSHHKITPKTDIWSLGLLYFYLFFEIKITGGFVYDQGLMQPKSHLKIMNDVEELQGVKELIMKMVRFEAKERIDAEEVLNILFKISSEMGVEFKSVMKF